MIKVFIDGSYGTTGLRIKERLSQRADIRLIVLSEEQRKNAEARREAINLSDVTFLCLPDGAAKEAAGFCENKNTVIIDTSTAHRADDGWAYGFPELHGQRELIKNSKRIANPGCHAIGFISLVAPLVQSGIIPADAELTCFSLTGYSGGGRKMIEQYENGGRSKLLDAPRTYGLGQNHKHLPEMMKICGLKNPPVFCPVVAPYFSGMQTAVSLPGLDAGKIKDIYKEYYRQGLISYSDEDEDGYLSAGAFADTDIMKIGVYGQSGRLVAVSRFDNLGKGACGAAIQNMNVATGTPESAGLII